MIDAEPAPDQSQPARPGQPKPGPWRIADIVDGRKLRIQLFEDAPEMAQLQQRPEIARIEDYIPPEMSNARARVILGLDPGTGLAGLTETGRGQIVAVADSGLDDQHPDFQGRILGLIALGRRNDASDPHGHGTHVAGSVLGDGAASNGEMRTKR